MHISRCFLKKLGHIHDLVNANFVKPDDLFYSEGEGIILDRQAGVKG